MEVQEDAMEVQEEAVRLQGLSEPVGNDKWAF